MDVTLIAVVVLALPVPDRRPGLAHRRTDRELASTRGV